MRTARNLFIPNASGYAMAAALLCVAVVLQVSPCAAQQVNLSRVTCASGVHLTVRDAPLSEVLQRMAVALKFQLRFESEADPPGRVHEFASQWLPRLTSPRAKMLAT